MLNKRQSYENIEEIIEFERNNYDITVYKLSNINAVTSRFKDSYDDEDIAAWNNHEWKFVDIICTASRLGIILGSTRVDCLEQGSVGGEYGIDPFELLDDFDIIKEAIENADQTILRLE